MKKALINREEEIPMISLAKDARKLLDRLRLEKKKRFIITRNENPEAVLLSLNYYDELMDLIEEMRDKLNQISKQKNVWDRVKSESNLKNAITLEELGSQHGFEK
ncbi:MAG: type II toxin-antitoxin system Phd/YefM family antitoxin [Deltaproteobacteria bacterium]|nr:type II toxin-antitoxin system Phd/YefM family antitoxin [Deltaproteobacteria bacterium]